MFGLKNHIAKFLTTAALIVIHGCSNMSMAIDGDGTFAKSNTPRDEWSRNMLEKFPAGTPIDALEKHLIGLGYKESPRFKFSYKKLDEKTIGRYTVDGRLENVTHNVPVDSWLWNLAETRFYSKADMWNSHTVGVDISLGRQIIRINSSFK